MRHAKTHRKFNRRSDHRRSMLANLCASLIKHEQITTTTAKARELRPYAEKLISRFSNPAIGDQMLRLCSNGAAKMPVYLQDNTVGTLKRGSEHRRGRAARLRHFRLRCADILPLPHRQQQQRRH